MMRRTLLLAAMVVLLWGAPAYAQSYGDILAQGDETGDVVITGTEGATSAGDGGSLATTSARDGGSLATTGRNDIVPLVQGSIVLIGCGVLLVLVARRRHTARSATA